MEEDLPPGIDRRAQDFCEAVMRFVKTIAPEPGTRNAIDQLVDAAGGVSANRQEATSASSRREFIRFNEIALRCVKESGVWLRACQAAEWGEPQSRLRLLEETIHLKRIFGAIVVNSKRGGAGGFGPSSRSGRPKPT
jgi:four helix bundle protein